MKQGRSQSYHDVSNEGNEEDVGMAMLQAIPDTSDSKPNEQNICQRLLKLEPRYCETRSITLTLQSSAQ